MLPTRRPDSCLARAIAISRTASSWPMTRRERAAAIALGSRVGGAPGSIIGNLLSPPLDPHQHPAPPQTPAESGEADPGAGPRPAPLPPPRAGDGRRGRGGG